MDAARRLACFVRLLAQLSEGQTVRSSTIRRDEYDVDEDGGQDGCGRLLAQLLKQQTVGSCSIRRDEYDVDEDGGEDAGGKDDRE